MYSNGHNRPELVVYFTCLIISKEVSKALNIYNVLEEIEHLNFKVNHVFSILQIFRFCVTDLQNMKMHTLRKKIILEHLFWCFRLSQIEDSIQYLEGP